MDLRPTIQHHAEGYMAFNDAIRVCVTGTTVQEAVANYFEALALRIRTFGLPTPKSNPTPPTEEELIQRIEQSKRQMIEVITELEEACRIHDAKERS